MSALSVGAISSADGPLAVFTGGGRGAVLLVWLAVINLVTFAVYGIDKAKAKRGAWRVPEKTLFLLPLLGGSLGAQIALAIWLYLR